MSDQPFFTQIELGTELLQSLNDPESQLLVEVGRNTNTDVNLRGNLLHVRGPRDGVLLVQRFFDGAAALAAEGFEVPTSDVRRCVRELRADPEARLEALLADVVVVNPRRRPVLPKSAAQQRYIRLIQGHDLTFGIGPAGTGKTYLAMAVAVSALMSRKVKRIILTRPAVEAGERLGFLPGDLAEKVNPYLRPLYDALNDMLDFEKVEQLRSRGQIEVAPLAFMRGRTLSDAFVILDEAQNATSEQMRMFLTRLGHGSKAVVTGDVTQTDLPVGSRSGLKEARDILTDVEGIGFQHFTESDVVRHPLVQRIVVAYEERDRQLAARREAESASTPESLPSPSVPADTGPTSR